MTVHQCLERLLQRRHIKSGFDPDSLGHVIGGTLRRQLMEKPQALLAVREWIFGWGCERAGKRFLSFARLLKALLPAPPTPREFCPVNLQPATPGPGYAHLVRQFNRTQ